MKLFTQHTTNNTYGTFHAKDAIEYAQQDMKNTKTGTLK